MLNTEVDIQPIVLWFHVKSTKINLPCRMIETASLADTIPEKTNYQLQITHKESLIRKTS